MHTDIREWAKEMQLTKTDFIQYLNCSKSLWLLKHDPGSYPPGDFSAFLQKIAREGYEVERYVRDFFEAEADRAVSFQRVFETEDGLFARADACEHSADGRFILYEIKSSTRVKTDAAHNHLKDACFQKICAQRAGHQIDAVFIVHLNGEYVRDGDVDPALMLTFVDETDRVKAIEDETAAEIDQALSLLAHDDLDRRGCTCLYKSRAHHCDAFALFNPDIPKPSIYSLPRLSEKKRTELVNNGVFDVLDIGTGFQLTPNQSVVVAAARAGTPVVDVDTIRAFLSEWQFPLYFFDYETYASAVPLIDRTSPHKHFPVQYSLHALHEDGTLEHHEYLEREARLPDLLFKKLRGEIGPKGSIVSWHASFEKTRNKEMAELLPELADFLIDVNERTVDLEDIFKNSYVDARFDGSTSIKKVLPVICPDLSYQGMDVQDGASAMDAWEKMIRAERDESDKIAKALLSYCELDTLAMVEIYKFLATL
jgi:CRISPR/Cas system-associated exonuclease Cas4 (RecB family)